MLKNQNWILPTRDMGYDQFFDFLNNKKLFEFVTFFSL